MKILKPIANFLFAIVLSIFLVFLLINIAYGKREAVKLGVLAKLSDFYLSFQSLYQHGSAKALEFKLAYKNNRLS